MSADTITADEFIVKFDILMSALICKRIESKISQRQIEPEIPISSCRQIFTNSNWWRAESHLSVCFCRFAPTFWESGGDLRMIFCQYVSTVWVVSTLKCGGDTRTFNYYNWIHLNFLHSEVVGMLKILLSYHLVKLSLPSIIYSSSPTLFTRRNHCQPQRNVDQNSCQNVFRSWI